MKSLSYPWYLFFLSIVLGFYFPSSSMRITPNTPLLPEILPTEYDVCGRIIVNQIPSSLLSQFRTTDRRVRVTRDNDNDDVVSTIGVRLDAEGAQFCTRLASGDYQISVDTSESEAGQGFLLTPKMTTVSVTHFPVKDVKFEQV